MINIDVDPSRISSKGSISIRYVTRDNQTRIIIAKNKQIGDYLVIIVECIVVI